MGYKLELYINYSNFMGSSRKGQGPLMKTLAPGCKSYLETCRVVDILN
jgi:hypothetical protein